MKAAAHTLPADARRARHRSDFATLAALVSRRDLQETLSKGEAKHLRHMLTAVRGDPTAIEGDTQIEDGLARLSTWLT